MDHWLPRAKQADGEEILSITKIQDIMNGRSNYKYFTKIVLSMMFYCFELDKHSQHLCVITTKFGIYRYLRLPMGVKVSPDVAQNIIIIASQW